MRMYQVPVMGRHIVLQWAEDAPDAVDRLLSSGEFTADEVGVPVRVMPVISTCDDCGEPRHDAHPSGHLGCVPREGGTSWS